DAGRPGGRRRARRRGRGGAGGHRRGGAGGPPPGRGGGEPARLVFFPGGPRGGGPGARGGGRGGGGLRRGPERRDGGARRGARTRQLAEFLYRQRAAAGATDVTLVRPDGLLFNGGALEPAVVRERIADVVAAWHGTDGWRPTVLETRSLQLAVARGAAYFGL